MAKQFAACNWAPSRITEEQLNRMVSIGTLPKKTEIQWRVPGTENPPTPRQGEVVIFVDHIGRGFKPPGSKFFWDIGPNSMSNLCNFQVFYEVYLQEEPTTELFRDFFHLNRRTEFVNGPNTELGGVSIQKQKEDEFPHAKLHSHPKDWNQTWFYCKDTSPEDENPLPGYRDHRLSNTHPLPQRLSSAERATYAPQLAKLRPFMANGLSGVNFVRCWISWRILPLSRRSGLMCEYTGELEYSQHHINIQLSEEEVTEGVKKILNESESVYRQTGLNPFYTKKQSACCKYCPSFLPSISF